MANNGNATDSSNDLSCYNIAKERVDLIKEQIGTNKCYMKNFQEICSNDVRYEESIFSATMSDCLSEKRKEQELGQLTPSCPQTPNQGCTSPQK